MRLCDVADIKHAIGALLLVSYWPSRRMIRRQAEEIERLKAAGVVDLGPMVDAAEDLVGALRQTGCRRSADASGAIRAVP